MNQELMKQFEEAVALFNEATKEVQATTPMTTYDDGAGGTCTSFSDFTTVEHEIAKAKLQRARDVLHQAREFYGRIL